MRKAIAAVVYRRGALRRTGERASRGCGASGNGDEGERTPQLNPGLRRREAQKPLKEEQPEIQ